MGTPTHANGWLQEQTVTDVLFSTKRPSAVEAVARKVQMTTDLAEVPRYSGTGVDIVAKGAVIPVKDLNLDTVILNAVKFADRYAVPVEDLRDAVANYLDASKQTWTANFGVKLDNACLGVTATATAGTTVPFVSVYAAAGSAGRIQTAGNLTFEDLVTSFDAAESLNSDLVVIAHPSFKGQLRNLKDEAGIRVVDTVNVLGGQELSLFGNTIVFSDGAKTSTTATDTPTGNPLLIVGSKKNLILGVRDGIESQVSDVAQWETDVVELKMRARRGFVVADGAAFRVIEKTAAV